MVQFNKIIPSSTPFVASCAGIFMASKIINDLITYSKQHLTTEEALLEKYDYPELAEQKEQHKLFIAKIEEFKEDFRKNHFMLHFNMAIFLKTWISNHIEVLDKKYSQFLNDRGVF